VKKMRNSLYTNFYESVKRYPDRVAICTEQKQLSYLELNNRVIAIATNLKNYIEDTQSAVGILLSRSPDLIASILAVNMLGISYVPLDVTMPEDRIHYIIQDSDISVLITDESNKEHFHGKTTVQIEKLCETKKSYIEPQSGKYVYRIYTSGSTGNPKGVVITNHSILNFFDGLDEAIDLKDVSRMLCLTTVSFDIFVLEAFYALHCGLSIVLTADGIESNPKMISYYIEKYCADVIQMTPSRLRMLREYDKNLTCLSKVKVLLVGGEVFPSDLLHELQNKTSAKIYNMYGPTEATVWCFIADLTESNRVHIGQPMKNVSYKLVGDTEDTGELYISGECLAEKYYNNQELTDEKFIFSSDGKVRYYKSGDFCKRNSYGELECIGRLDNQIKIRGYRVEIEEVENTICSYDSELQCICFPEGDHGLICYYVYENKLDQTKLKSFLSKKLPAYMIPFKFVQITELKYTINGKIDRKFLKSHIQELTVMPENITEKVVVENPEFEKLARIFHQLNNQYNEISLNTSLQEMGINSIDFISLIVKVEDEFNIIFEDDKLDMTKFPDILSLFSYIQQQTNKTR